MLMLAAIVVATDVSLHIQKGLDLREPCLEADVPVINMSALIHGPWDAQAVVARELVEAGRNGSAGFFTIVGHGMESSMELMHQVADDFFRWPAADKLKLAPQQFNSENRHRFRGYAPATVNGKELLDWSNPAFSHAGYMKLHLARHNATDVSDLASREFLHEPMPCPADRPELCIALAAHWERMQALGEKVLRGFAIGLGHAAGRGDADADYFDRAMRVGEPMSCLRFNFYPVVSADGTPVRTSKIDHQKAGLACEEHRDMTLITLLDQGDVGGLQIFQDDQWKDVPVTPGALVVNIGGGIQRWTNDALVASTHRVRLVDSQRISIPFFLEAAYDTPMDCLPSTVSASRPCAHKATTYGPYIQGTFKLFKEYASRMES